MRKARTGGMTCEREGARKLSVPASFHTPLLCLLLFVGCSQPSVDSAAPESLTASLTFSTNHIRIGDVAKVTLSIQHPASSDIEVPDIAREKDIIVRDVRMETKSVARDETLSHVSYDILSLSVGSHVLSSNDIRVVAADGSTTMVPFPLDPLTVLSTLEEGHAEFRGLKPFASWRYAFPWWAILILVMVLLIIIAGLCAMRRRRPQESMVIGPPPTPAHIVALEALQELIKKQYIEKGMADAYYVELSDIVRHYVENRFHLHAPEQTTEEFIRDVSRAHRLSHDHRILLQQFLEQCDLVKFARHRPEEGDMRAAFNAAERFVEETKQSMTPTQAEAA